LKRGDVFWAELVPRSGSEQTGRRPVIILSHDAFNQTANWRSIIVVPVSTSDVQRGRGLTVVALPAGTASLPHASVAFCHQVTTLDRMKLSRQLGSLPPKILREVEQALKATMDLE
jgi:mRNA interferase MazF